MADNGESDFPTPFVQLPNQRSKLNVRLARRVIDKGAIPKSLLMYRPRSSRNSDDKMPIPSNDVINPVKSSFGLEAWLGPRLPGRVGFSCGPGTNPGDIRITVNTPLPSAGDAAKRDDGLATVKKLIYITSADDTFHDLDISAPFGGAYNVSGFTPGNAYTVSVLMVNSVDAVSPLFEIENADAKENPAPVGTPPTYIGGLADRSGVVGTPMVFTWSDYFTGATSYVVTSGVPGGVSSGTGNVTYTITPTTVGASTLGVKAVNADGETLRSCTVTISAAVVAPAKIAELPSMITPTGGSFNINLTSIFSGTSPTYSISPAQAKLKIENGFLKNNGALDTAVAEVTITVTATNSAGSASDATQFAVQVPVVAADKMVPVVSRSVFRFTDWHTPILTFPTGPVPTGKAIVGWTTADLDANNQPPPANIESGALGVAVKAEGTAGEYQIYMDVAGDNGVQSPRKDYSIFGSSDATRATKLRFSYKTLSTDPWAPWSDAVTVPNVSIPQANSPWIPMLMQWEAAFTNNKCGSRGMQFQRSVSYNWGKNDTSKNNWAFTAQDVDQGWATQDAFATMYIARGMGCYGNNEGGIYYNSDDDLLVRITTDSNSSGKYGGIYVSNDDGVSYKKYNPTRTGPLPSFDNFMAGNNNRYNMNQIARRPQNAAGNLTHAQRPIFILEQYNNGTGIGGDITRIFLWRSDDNLATEPEMVYEFTPIGDFANGGDALRYIDVDTNGDILVSGKKGAWFTQDSSGESGWSKVFTGADVMAQFIKDGKAYLALAGAAGGIRKTANIRTTAFSNPTTDLTNSYKCNHMGVAFSNPNRIAVCSPNANPMLSTDGGVNFNQINSPRALGEASSSSRYKIQTGPSGFYFHPRNEMICWAHTNQTATRSTDGAANFDGNDCQFFDGSFVKAIGFDKTNPDRFVITQTDSICQYMAASPMWINSMDMGKSKITSAGGELGAEVAAAGGGPAANMSSDCAAFLPNNKALIGVTRNYGGGLNVPVIMDLTSEVPTVRGQPNDVTTRGVNTDYHPDNDDMIFMGRFRVTNLSAADPENITITDMGKEFLRYSKAGGVFATYWGGTGAKTSTVYRSTAANGGSSTTWGTCDSSDLKTFAVDPFVAKRLLFSNGNQAEVFEMKENAQGNVVVTNLNANIKSLITAGLNAYPATVANRVTVFPIQHIIADYRRSGLFYAYMTTPGCPCLFQSVDGGETWEDITDNCPRGTNARIYVAMLSGELIFGGSQGTRIRKAGAGYPAATHKDKIYNQWDTYYKKAETKNPPVA